MRASLAREAPSAGDKRSGSNEVAANESEGPLSLGVVLTPVAYAISLAVNLVAIGVDVAILAGLRVPALAMVLLVIFPPTVWIIAVRLHATERRHWATLRQLHHGTLGLIH